MTRWRSWFEKFLDAPPVPTPPDKEGLRLKTRPRVILFDVYGTLLAPKLGDLEAQVKARRGRESFLETARHFGFPERVGEHWAEAFYREIEREHEVCRNLGISRAEVVIEKIWERLLAETVPEGSRPDPRDVAVYRECRANPVAAYQGAGPLLKTLRDRGIAVGLASNAQFYTLPVLEYCLGLDGADVFDPDWVFLSYELGFAKPDPHFFRLAKIQALRKGLAPAQVLMVGNDPVNDVDAARVHGLEAVLFVPGCPAEWRDRVEGSPRMQNFESLRNAVFGQGA